MSDAPPLRDLLPGGYGELLDQLKTEVQSARLRATTAANSELIGLYWRVGRLILDRQADAGWRAQVVDRLARDLRAGFPTMKGLSRRTLFYMRAFAAAYTEGGVQRRAALLPWGHVVVLLDKLAGAADRDW